MQTCRGGAAHGPNADLMTIDNISSRHVILSGCSGGGKSTLLADLAGRGFGTVSEPGRRIVGRVDEFGGMENSLFPR